MKILGAVIVCALIYGVWKLFKGWLKIAAIIVLVLIALILVLFAILA